MNITDAIVLLMRRAGLSERQLSTKMGKSPTHVSNYTYHKNIPSATNLALLADACDFDLQLVSRNDDEVITIDPE